MLLPAWQCHVLSHFDIQYHTFWKGQIRLTFIFSIAWEISCASLSHTDFKIMNTLSVTHNCCQMDRPLWGLFWQPSIFFHSFIHSFIHHFKWWTKPWLIYHLHMFYFTIMHTKMASGLIYFSMGLDKSLFMIGP